MKTQETLKINIALNRSLLPQVQSLLKEMGIPGFHLSAGRSVVLREKDGLLKTSSVLEEDPLAIVFFYVTELAAPEIAENLIQKLDLKNPGRGTLTVEKTNLHDEENLFINSSTPKSISSISHLDNLMGLCCIVQKGQGNEVARAILDLGLSVPAIFYGLGTGLRDKLGILRITIPAEKEVLNLIVSSHDAQEAMNALIDAGKLDQPGKGFIYLFPIQGGVMNTKSFRGKMKHAASIEQIIAAVDDLKKNTEWRKRDSTNQSSSKQRKFLERLKAFTFYCNEGKAEELVAAAMQNGAAGATISKLKYVSLVADESKKISPAREMSQLIIGPQQVEVLADVLMKHQLFSKETCGFIETKEVPKACTYLKS